MTIIQSINDFIEKKGITKKFIAEKSGIPYRTLQDAVNSKKRDDISFSLLKKIVQTMGFNICYFLKESAKVKPYEIGEEKHIVNDKNAVYGERVSELKYTIDLQKKKILRLEKELLKEKSEPIKHEKLGK